MCSVSNGPGAYEVDFDSVLRLPLRKFETPSTVYDRRIEQTPRVRQNIAYLADLIVITSVTVSG